MPENFHIEQNGNDFTVHPDGRLDITPEAIKNPASGEYRLRAEWLKDRHPYTLEKLDEE